ncbi:IDEAL domain-containing protein [Paraliobacillus sp. X-1268]|uniref:IDEAL domain-containing protein n=1 Tax=Paraliobacillus sp. X-1268 TaxID=2213193 RepID=UPI000E3BD042|nr:IDEAL domain-containing protein [Paraliobacillus sp. X-1268]
METNHTNQVKIGDWVRAKSSKGELIHGFVEKNALDHNIIQLRVVASDNKMLMGHSIQINKIKLNKLDMTVSKTEKQLRQLIDIALETKDEAWFLDLTKQLQYVEKTKKQAYIKAYQSKPNSTQEDFRSN